MATVKGGASKNVRKLVESENFDTGRMRRLSSESINVLGCTLAHAAVSEQAVTVNGLRVGDYIYGITTANASHPVLDRAAYRDTCLTINTLNQLTTNFAGQAAVVHILKRTTLT